MTRNTKEYLKNIKNHFKLLSIDIVHDIDCLNRKEL